MENEILALEWDLEEAKTSAYNEQETPLEEENVNLYADPNGHKWVTYVGNDPNADRYCVYCKIRSYKNENSACKGGRDERSSRLPNKEWMP